jgi:hypothetical protein
MVPIKEGVIYYSLGAAQATFSIKIVHEVLINFI